MNRWNNCPFCGNKQVNISNSLHIWSVEYDCGLYIVGVIGEDDYQIERECKKIKKLN